MPLIAVCALIVLVRVLTLGPPHPARPELVLSALSASAINEVFEVTLGGLITVTAAFVFLGASGALGGKFFVGFTSLPVVFTYLGAWERPIGALWFGLLFLAAMTSSVSMLQPAKALLSWMGTLAIFILAGAEVICEGSASAPSRSRPCSWWA